VARVAASTRLTVARADASSRQQPPAAASSHFGTILGSILGTFFTIFGILFWTNFWSHFGTILGPFWSPFWSHVSPKGRQDEPKSAIKSLKEQTSCIFKNLKKASFF